MKKSLRVEAACRLCGADRGFVIEGEAPPPCGGCGDRPATVIPAALREQGRLEKCAVCGDQQIYRQRDFDRRIGVGIVAAGAVLSLALLLVSVKLAYGVLFGMAIVDALLYSRLPEVAICYRCKAEHRGWAKSSELQPFDLLTAELIDHQERESREGSNTKR